MMNEQLIYYWFEDSDGAGLKFDTERGYMLSEIDEILKRNNTKNINGCFVHFGNKQGECFSRTVITSQEGNGFTQECSLFSAIDYKLVVELNKTTVKSLLELEKEITIDDTTKGGSMLKRFGLYGNDE
jgi:hypothetical protein